MGFCSYDQYLEFMRSTPELEKMLVQSGIMLFKIWFSVSQARAAVRALRVGRSSQRGVPALRRRNSSDEWSRASWTP
jgi:polyphosphate kinase 2 (PPK2 family)